MKRLFSEREVRALAFFLPLAGLAVLGLVLARPRTTVEDAARIEALIKKCGLPTELPYTAEALANAALSDKKRAGSTLPVITVEGLGRCTVQKIAASDYAGWLRQGGAQ